MKTWHYALLVLLGGCSYGALSTFVKLAYSAGFTSAAVTGSQFLMGTLLIWIVFEGSEHTQTLLLGQPQFV